MNKKYFLVKKMPVMVKFLLSLDKILIYLELSL